MPEDNIVVFKTMKISIKQDFRSSAVREKKAHYHYFLPWASVEDWAVHVPIGTKTLQTAQLM